MRQIRCPHCQSNLDIGEYTHDTKLNIFCTKCKGLIFATNAEDEAKLSVLYQKPAHSYVSPGNGNAARFGPHPPYAAGGEY